MIVLKIMEKQKLFENKFVYMINYTVKYLFMKCHYIYIYIYKACLNIDILHCIKEWRKLPKNIFILFEVLFCTLNLKGQGELTKGA